MEVECIFTFMKWKGEFRYTCKIVKKVIFEGPELKFVGGHRRDKTNTDVTAMSIMNCDMPKIPQGLTKNFPHLQAFQIVNSRLKELDNEHLIEYKNLKLILFDENLLESLPANLFKGLEKLEYIDVSGLKVIEPTILDNFADGQLKHVNFVTDSCYDKCFSVVEPMRSNATLEEVKNELLEKFYSDIKNVQELITENQSLKKQIGPGNLQQDMKNFVQQDQDLMDFTIKIDEKKFRVHKFVIAARSTIFADMLRNNIEADSLNLTDITVEIFEKILNYIYNDQLPNDDDFDFTELFVASSRLKIQCLKDFAAKRLATLICPETAFEILKLSNKHEHEILREKAFDEIKKMHPDFEFEDDWSKDEEKLNQIFEYQKEKEELERKYKRLRTSLLQK